MERGHGELDNIQTETERPMVDINYLDDERKKLWAEIERVKTEILPSVQNKIDALDIPEAIKKFNSAKNSIDKLKAKYKDYESLYNDMIAKTDEIKTTHTQAAGLLTKIEAIKTSADTADSLIAEDVAKIKTAIDENPDIADDIDTMNEQIATVGSIHEKIVERHGDIEKLYTSIYGKDSKDESGKITRIPGLKDELTTAYDILKDKMEELEKTTQATFNEKLEGWEGQYTAISDKISSLLPAALTTGLAHAYQEKRIAEQTKFDNGYTGFKWTIGFLSVVALIPITLATLWLFGVIDKDVNQILGLSAILIPLYGALIWLGFYQNKSLNLSKKLIEEYAHKEVNAKTFEGLSKQISDFGDDDIARELRAKLLVQTLETTARNPADCITNQHKSDNPMLALLNLSHKYIKEAGQDNFGRLIGVFEKSLGTKKSNPEKPVPPQDNEEEEENT